MSNQPSTGYVPRYNPNQNPKFAVTYNIPDKKAPTDTVNKIFLRIANGKYFDIKRMITQERSSLNLHDIQNKSIIHYILLNQTLSKNDKYELINSVLEMGAPVDSSDTNGVRPLHLASGQQNRNVINLLLERGAEINSQDNNFMTPLHYAVTPETVVCPPINERQLIPGKDLMMNQRSDPLFDTLFINFQRDPKVRMYISHMAHIFKFRFPYDDDDLTQDTKDLNQIINELSNQKAYPGDDINATFNEKLLGFNKSIHAKTLKKLSRSIEKIKDGVKDGWGPVFNGVRQEQHHVLPFQTIKHVHAEIHQGISKNVDTIIQEMEQNLNDISKKIDNYVKIVAATINVVDIIFSYHFFVKEYFNETKPNGTLTLIGNISVKQINKSFMDLAQVLIIVNQMMPSDFNDKNNFELKPMQPFTQDELKKTSLDTNISINFDRKTPFNIIDNYIGEIKRITLMIKQKIIDMKDKFARGSLKLISQTNIIYDICDIQLLLINISFIFFLLSLSHSKITLGLEQYFNDFETNNYPSFYTLVNGIMRTGYNKNVRVTPKTKYYTVEFDAGGRPKVLDENITLHTNYQYVFDVYMKTLNPNEMTFFVINKDESEYKPNSHFIYSEDDSVKPKGSVKRKFIVESQFDIDNKIKSMNNYRKKNRQYVNELQLIHNIIINAQEKMNKLIDIHNQINGSIFIFLFNNQMVDDSYNHEKTDIINHLLMTDMSNVNQLPDTFSKLSDMLEPILFPDHDKKYSIKNYAKTVQMLIKSYGYNITNENKMYTIDNLSKPSILTNGLLTTIIENDSTVVHRKYIMLGSIRNKNKIVTEGPNRGNVIGFDFEKNIIDQNMSIVGTVLDHHIYLLKLILIMYFVQKIYNLKMTNTATKPIDKMLLNKINAYSNNVKDLSTDETGQLIAMVAKMVDDIMVSTIKNFAHISATNYINYLVKKNPKGSTLLGSTNDPASFTNLSQLIVKPMDRSKFKGKDYIDQIVSDSVNHPNADDYVIDYNDDMEMIQFFAHTNDPKTNNFQNRLIDFDSMNSLNDICYDIDEDVVSLLLSKGADYNIVDRSGMTPLWFAVYLQNERIIGTLLRAGSKVLGNNHNIYEAVYKQLLNSVQSSPILNVNAINQRVEDHLKKKTQMNQLFSNSHLILEMTSYLFVHQLTANTGKYPNLWSKDMYQKILDMIGLDHRLIKDLIPLAKVNPEIISENIKGYMVINQSIDSYTKQLIDERDILIRLDHSVRDIKKEINSLSSDPNPGQNDYRLTEMNSLLNELYNQKSITVSNIKKITQNINNLISAKEGIDNTHESNVIVDALKKSNEINHIVKTQKKNRYICDIYEMFFKRIMNKGKDDKFDDMTYINLWSELLASNDKKDFTQVIKNLQLYMIEQGIQQPNIFLESWDPVCELYEKVLDRYGKDYLELSMYLNANETANYVLKQIFCIMVHVFSHIISVNYIITITQLLAKQDNGETSNSVARNIFMSMKTSGFLSFCMDTMPQQIIKIVCKIYDGEKDPLAQSSVTDILNKSLDFLTQSTFTTISDNQINMAKEYVVPFFASYMEAYTAEMHALMVKQIKSFIVQNKWLRIIKLLAEKALIEEKSS